jgi:hypothetical protein
MDFHELTHEQRRQLIDVQQVYKAYRSSAPRLRELGTLRWQTVKGKRYLYDVRGQVRKSLGPETPELIQRKSEHDADRVGLKKRVAELKQRLDKMAPVNRALGLGRLPETAAKIVRELDEAELLGSHITVVGTNALYAYETSTGTVVESKHVATGDADLLWDTRKSLSLAGANLKPKTIMALLRKADKTFQADYGFNATNNEGYVVDLLCPETQNLESIKIPDDLEPIEMAGADWLIASPPHTETVIAHDGYPLRIVVPEPRTFALHKLWVSQRPDRSAVKRPRDIEHARVVGELVKTYLQLPFSTDDMPWLPDELKTLVKELQ